MSAYIGPLSTLLFDNSAIVFGEEEGAVGGIADLEARVGRLPQYLPCAAREVVTDVERAKSAKRAQSVVAQRPKLPPSIAMAVDVDPAVVAASRDRVDVSEECRRVARRMRLISNAGVPHLVPPILCEGGREGEDLHVRLNYLMDKLDEVTATHTCVRKDAVRKVVRNLTSSREAQEGGEISSRIPSDMLNTIVEVLLKYKSERVLSG